MSSSRPAGQASCPYRTLQLREAMHPKKGPTSAEWEQKRDDIRNLLIVERQSLKQVMATMDAGGFCGTKRMYKFYIKKWGFSKNLTRQRYIALRSSGVAGTVDESGLKLGRDGQNLSPERVTKYLKRKKWKEAGTAIISEPSRDVADRPLLILDEYEEHCPYRGWEKKFRLTETFSSDAEYVGDSFGYHSYINIDDERLCSTQCLCQRHEVSQHFTFLASKNGHEIYVTILSQELLSTIRCLHQDDLQPIGESESRKYDCLTLLRHRHKLQSCLETLRISSTSEKRSLVLELELLINGLLGDTDVFNSFGLEQLHQRGTLDREQLAAFQRQKLDKDIDNLDHEFGLEDCFHEKTAPPMDPISPDQRTETAIPEAYCGLCIFDMLLFQNDKISDPPPAHRYCDYHLIFLKALEILDSRTIGSMNLEYGISDGRHDQVRELLTKGVKVNAYSHEMGSGEHRTPLSDAVASGRTEIVRLLLTYGVDVNHVVNKWDWSGIERGRTPLEQAKRKGFTDIVNLLQNKDKDVKKVQAALFQASKFGNLDQVQFYVETGADINALTSHGTALSAAAGSYHAATVRYLVQQGADISIASILLQNDGNNRGLRLISKAGGLVAKPNEPTSARYFEPLYMNFIYEYEVMKGAAQGSSTDFHNVNERITDYGVAWNCATSSMRKLSHGEALQDVTDIIPFLCLAKAMVEVLKCRGEDCLPEFFADLNRWQILFPADDERDSYKEAMHLMWDVQINSIDYRDMGVLQDLQKLATTLVGRVKESLQSSYFDHSNGYLESNQRSWLYKKSQAVLAKQQGGNTSSTMPLEGSSSQQTLPEVTNLEPPDPPNILPPTSVDNEVEQQLPHVNPMLVCILAGAIFTIVLAFLQTLRMVISTFTPNSITSRSLKTLRGRLAVWRRYMGMRPLTFSQEPVNLSLLSVHSQ